MSERLRVKQTSSFRKDIKLAKKRGKDLAKLASVAAKLIDGLVLDPKYRDHNLPGNFTGYRECHIEPNMLAKLPQA